MKVLIACEFSGVVREAFKAKGHDAVSCDLLPSEQPGHHIQDDVEKHLNEGWDMMIAFPPCTHLASSGAQYWPEKQKDGRQQEAIDFVYRLFGANINRIAIENPVGILSTKVCRPHQIIQPYEFGDPYRKKTCLWLWNLPALKPTNIVKPIASWHSGSSRSGPRKDGSRKISDLPALHGNSRERSRTFPGIAEAMAAQWG